MIVGTKMSSNVNLAKVEVLISVREEKIHKAKAECAKKALPLLIKEFQKEKVQGLTHIFVIGSTPEWNDGEECIHRTEVFIENDRTDHKYTDVSEYMERVYDDADYYDDPPEHVKAMNVQINRNDAQKISLAFKQKYGDILEEVLGTNWKLEIEFIEDGELKITHDDYDCGY